jgi:hypothetical protein
VSWELIGLSRKSTLGRATELLDIESDILQNLVPYLRRMKEDTSIWANMKVNVSRIIEQEGDYVTLFLKKDGLHIEQDSRRLSFTVI